jgi:hypothetical protein
MGAFITKILERFHGLVDKKILLLGLDAAGIIKVEIIGYGLNFSLYRSAFD